MMRCNVCGGATFHEGRVDEVFRIEGRRVLVEGIPARVCERCGEAAFEPEVVERVRLVVHGGAQPTRREPMDVYALQ